MSTELRSEQQQKSKVYKCKFLTEHDCRQIKNKWNERGCWIKQRWRNLFRSGISRIEIFLKTLETNKCPKNVCTIEITLLLSWVFLSSDYEWEVQPKLRHVISFAKLVGRLSSMNFHSINANWWSAHSLVQFSDSYRNLLKSLLCQHVSIDIK